MITDCQPSLWSLGDPSIAWIAEHLREPWLSPIMIFISNLGQVGPTLFTIAIGYWLWHRRYMKYIAYSMFSALLLNIWLKGIIQECRPPETFWLEQVHNSYSFPSGHAQVSIALWAGIAYYLYLQRTYAWLAPCFLFIGIIIALSRPYLGVHYPQDIIVGLALGLAVLTIGIIFEKKQLQPLKNFSLWGQSLFLIFLLAIYTLIVNSPSGSYVKATASLFGFWLGCQWETRLSTTLPRKYSEMIMLLFIGISGTLLLWKGVSVWSKHLSVEMELGVTYLQYILLGIWVTYGAPAFIQCCHKRVIEK